MHLLELFFCHDDDSKNHFMDFIYGYFLNDDESLKPEGPTNSKNYVRQFS